MTPSLNRVTFPPSRPSQQGQVDCWPLPCPPVDCEFTTVPEGECCPRCVTDPCQADTIRNDITKTCTDEHNISRFSGSSWIKHGTECTLCQCKVRRPESRPQAVVIHLLLADKVASCDAYFMPQWQFERFHGLTAAFHRPTHTIGVFFWILSKSFTPYLILLLFSKEPDLSVLDKALLAF